MVEKIVKLSLLSRFFKSSLLNKSTSKTLKKSHRRGRRKKCLIIYASDVLHQAGGVQKVVCSLASALCQRGWAVSFVTERQEDLPFFYPVDARVKIINIAPSFLFKIKKSFRKRIIKLFYPSLLKRENPDVVICPSWNDLERASQQYPTVLMQHAPPQVTLRKTKRETVKRRYLSLLKHTSCVQVLCPPFVHDFEQFYSKIPIRCIGNPVDIANLPYGQDLPDPPVFFQHTEFQTSSTPHKNSLKTKRIPSIETDKTHPLEKEIPHPTILYAGRFDPEKNQHLLIQAFEHVHAVYPKARLLLYGAEEDKAYSQKCHQIANESSAKDHIFFYPPIPNLDPIYRQTDLYVSPSLSEGWGLTITEAMARGIPVVGLKSAAGVNCLIQDHENGLLTQADPDSLANGILDMLQHPQWTKSMIQQAFYSIQLYYPDRIYREWDSLLRQVIRLHHLTHHRMEK